MKFVKSIMADLGSALMLLTRLPLQYFLGEEEPDQLPRCVWAFPVAGGVTGLIAAGVLSAAQFAGLVDLIAVLLALLTSLFVTGALHEDGLADVADGFGGGSSRDQKLQIMRDSRIGSYGVIALLFSFGLRAAALTMIAHQGSAIAAILVAAMVSRSAMVGALTFMRPARTDGLGKIVESPPVTAVFAAVILALLPVFVFYPLPVVASLTATAIASGGAVCLIAQRQIGGYTGDVLGAVQQVSEISLFVMISLLIG